MSCRYPLHTRDYVIKLLEQDAAESKGWREEDRTLEEGTSSEEKDLSEGVVSVSVIAYGFILLEFQLRLLVSIHFHSFIFIHFHILNFSNAFFQKRLKSITSRDGKQWIFCKGCKKETSYAGWSTHCFTHHSKVNGKANADAGDTDDDGSRSKTQPKAKAGAEKTGRSKKGPAAKKKTSPRGS